MRFDDGLALDEKQASEARSAVRRFLEVAGGLSSWADCKRSGGAWVTKLGLTDCMMRPMASVNLRLYEPSDNI